MGILKLNNKYGLWKSTNYIYQEKGDWGWDIKIKIMVYDKKEFNG